MEADVVVNFIYFYTCVDEEDIEVVLKELMDAGLEPEKLDMWVEGLVKLTDSDKAPEANLAKDGL